MKKGFTLMELLVVMLIVGILSSIAIPQYAKIVEKGRFTKAQVMAKSLHDSCGRYISEYGVESYGDLPDNRKDIKRMDIGDNSLLPTGFELENADNSNLATWIKGAGFKYNLTGDCEVLIENIAAGAYNGTKIHYEGNNFTCTTNVGGACDIYGI